MAPIDHIIYIGCVRVPKATLLCFAIVGSMTWILFIFFFPGSWLAQNPRMTGSFSWRRTQLMRTCGVTPAHLLQRKPSPSPSPSYGFPYDIQSSSWVRIMHWSVFIVSISAARSPSFTRERTVFGTHYPSALSVLLRMVSFIHDP